MLINNASILERKRLLALKCGSSQSYQFQRDYDAAKHILEQIKTEQAKKFGANDRDTLYVHRGRVAP